MKDWSRRGIRGLVGATLGAALLTGVMTAPAESRVAVDPTPAARAIQPPAGFSCVKYARTISLAQPRVYSGYGRPELVLWRTWIYRWSGRAWYRFAQFDYTAYFSYFGFNLTSWAPIGRYHANTLNLPTYYAGYYKVMAGVVAANGGTWVGWLNGGRYCTIY